MKAWPAGWVWLAWPLWIGWTVGGNQDYFGDSPSYSSQEELEYRDYGDYEGVTGDYGDLAVLEDKPSIPSAIVLVNGSFTVDCYGGGEGGWHSGGHRLLHNGQVVDHQDVTRIQLLKQKTSSSHVSFKVSLASVSDSGTWTCTSRHKDKQNSHVNIAVVTFVNRPVLLVDGVLIQNNSVISGVEYSSLDLACAMIQPHATPQQGGEGWRLGDKPIFQSSHPLEVTTDDQGFLHSILNLHKFAIDRQHHTTKLDCFLGGETVGATLQVEYQPEFTISRVPGFGRPVLEHMTVWLKCSVDSQPSSRPVWRREGQIVSSTYNTATNTAEIHWTGIAAENEGWFQCETQHKFGNFSSVGYYLSVRPGEATVATQPTQAQGLTDQVIVEARGSQELMDHVVVEQVGKPEQRVGNCVEENPHGSPAPRVTPMSGNVSVLAGENISLAIEVCANPPANRIIWIGPQVLLRSGEGQGRFTSSLSGGDEDTCWQAVLDIDKVQNGDGGEYTLIVKNWYGIREGSVWLHVNASDYVASAAPFIVETLNTKLLLLFSLQIAALAYLI